MADTIVFRDMVWKYGKLQSGYNEQARSQSHTNGGGGGLNCQIHESTVLKAGDRKIFQFLG
jgi:hypothetical protein